MKTKRDGTTSRRVHRDMLDKLIENEKVGEMGLLDLIFIEEILNQKKEKRAT